MGQRHQIYVVSKTKIGNKVEYKAIGAYHHQWTFGFTAVANLTRLVLAIKRAKIDSDMWYTHRLRDHRRVNSLVCATYGIGLDGADSIVHNETTEGYLIKDNLITPQNGDNNDGCSLVVIDEIKEEVRACFFTPGYLEGEYWKDSSPIFTAFSRQRYLDFYYSKKVQKEDNFKNGFKQHLMLLNNTEIKMVTTKELKALCNFTEDVAVGA